MKDDPELLDYRNKFTFNQRGGSIEINNSTEREEVKISQYSGSNISINNVVNSETAINNKQTKVVYDEFKTVGNTLSEYAGKDRINRVRENSYDVKGFFNTDQVKPFADWRKEYRDIANTNAQFNIERGGKGFLRPSNSDGTTSDAADTALNGTRANNPDLDKKTNTLQLAVNNEFSGYGAVPKVKNNNSEVSKYTPVTVKTGEKSKATPPKISDITQAFGEGTGTQSPGVLEFGPNLSSATEDGSWNKNSIKDQLPQKMVDIQQKLFPLEQLMGNGGDEIESIKRHKITNIGAAINDYPAVRVDLKGRSQPTEVGVSENSAYTHYDYVPLVEDVDNAANFPCGNYTQNIGNKYNVFVGSGGVQIKTSGPMTISGTTVKIGGTKVNIGGAAGVAITSESNIDIMSPKIQLRSKRQIYIGSSLGVDRNLIVKGGAFIEGETYVNHITAPLEVQETYQTKVFGKLVPGTVIGKIEGEQVIAVGTPNSVELYNHSHHFPNIPLTLKQSNKEMRQEAYNNDINKSGFYASASPQRHEFKGTTSTAQSQ